MPATIYHTILERVDVLSYNVKSFRLKLPPASAWAFEPGQFVIVHVPKDLPAAPADVRARAAQAGGSTVKRAYSIASPPYDKGAVELCIQHVEQGAASTYFWKLKAGEPVTISGPHGRFMLKQPVNYEPVFLATGTGVAPFRSMIKSLCCGNALQPIWLLFGTRYEHSLLYEAEFRSLASMRHNFHYIPTVSRPKEWTGESGHIQQTFQKRFKEFANKEIYVCGWLQIVKNIVKDLQGFGVPPAQIHYEEWA